MMKIDDQTLSGDELGSNVTIERVKKAYSPSRGPGIATVRLEHHFMARSLRQFRLYKKQNEKDLPEQT
jgi:hypothetical protein